MPKKVWEVMGVSYLLVFLVCFAPGDQLVTKTDANGIVSSEKLSTSAFYFRTAGKAFVVQLFMAAGVYSVYSVWKRRRKRLT